MSGTDQVFNEHRQLLGAIAYRILGSWSDAEDVVQDAWIRWSGVDVGHIADPRAYLIRIATRLAIDRIRRVRARRETYLGPWLPEPVLTDKALSSGMETAEAVSMAMMIVLETLTPLERAVFVLHDAFSLSYAEIAEALDRAEPAVRQLARRARAHLRERDKRFDADPAKSRELTDRFLHASTAGDLQGLKELLASEVTLIADGGRTARAPRRPIQGADKVARFLTAVIAEPRTGFTIQYRDLNGSVGLVATSNGQPGGALLLDIRDGVIETVYLISNPEKLLGLNDA